MYPAAHNRLVQSGGTAQIRGGSGVIRLLLLLWLAEIVIFETSKGADAGTIVTLAGAGVDCSQPPNLPQ